VQSPLTPRTEPEARDLGITMDDAADASGADVTTTSQRSQSLGADGQERSPSVVLFAAAKGR
jgi:hypothetical protein